MQWFREWEAFVKGKDNGKDQTLGVCQGTGRMEMNPFAGSWLSLPLAGVTKLGRVQAPATGAACRSLGQGKNDQEKLGKHLNLEAARKSDGF